MQYLLHTNYQMASFNRKIVFSEECQDSPPLDGGPYISPIPGRQGNPWNTDDDYTRHSAFLLAHV